ncbi:MAG: GNAT family N-acetyltransferase [Rhodoglobus sp.]
MLKTTSTLVLIFRTGSHWLALIFAGRIIGMTISHQPWQHSSVHNSSTLNPVAQPSRLQLVMVPDPDLQALAHNESSTGYGPLVTPYLAGEECAGLWRYRRDQLAKTPADAPWVTRFVVVAGIRAAVGVAGFHGAPDHQGVVELGYRIEPQHRRNGYARLALETLLAVAAQHPAVRVVRATISPNNSVSRTLVEGYGFVVVGEQWDEEDGREIIFEVAADTVHAVKL